MDGSASIGLEQALLGHSLGFAPFASPTQVYVSLCLASTVPSETVPGLEASGGGYARMPATFALIAGPANVAANTTSIEFPQALSSWGQIGFFELWDAPNGGNRLYWGQLVSTTDFTTPLVLQVSAGDITRFSAGTLGVQASTGAGGTASIGAYLPLAGGQMAGPLLLAQDPLDTMEAATKGYVDAHSGSGGGPGFLPLSGGTMLGTLTTADLVVNGTLTGTSGTLSGLLTAATLATRSAVPYPTNAQQFSMLTGTHLSGAGVSPFNLNINADGALTSGTSYSFANISVNGDSVQAGTGPGGINYLSVFGNTSAGMGGSRNAIQARVNVTATTGNSGGLGAFYVGGAFYAIGTVNDNGTAGAGNSRGGLMALNTIVHTLPGGTYYNGVCSAEFDISNEGVGTTYREGIKIVLGGSDNYRGTQADYAFAFGQNEDHAGLRPGWANGITFVSPLAASPWRADSQLIGSLPDIHGGAAFVADRGVDFRNFTFTTAFLMSKGFTVDGAGRVAPSLVQMQANSTLDFNGGPALNSAPGNYLQYTTTGTPRLRYVVGANERWSVSDSGVVSMPNLPTSNAGLTAGALWSNGGVVMVMP